MWDKVFKNRIVTKIILMYVFPYYKDQNTKPTIGEKKYE